MKTRSWFLAGALGLYLVGWGIPAPAEAPAPAAPVTKIYTRDKFFRLPVALDDKERAALQEVRLYVKNGPDEAWRCKEAAPPSKMAFDYRVFQDGEYWFAIATVDKSGKLAPTDLERLAPGLIVVVDTQPPELSVRRLPGDVIQCKVSDANLDPGALRAEYQTSDRDWQPLEPVPDDPGAFRLPQGVGPQVVVRAKAVDLAGNAVSRVLPLSVATPLAEEAGPILRPPESRSAKIPLMPLGPDAKLPLVSPPPDAKLPSPAPSPERDAPADRQLVGSTHVSLAYQIEQQGPSGVSKVEAWMTRDQGATWQRLGEAPGHRSPMELDLPGEGLYGISLVVTNGSGVGGTPPAKGDAPDYWVEVDQTKPAAQLLSVHPGSGADAAALEIAWLASDRNLGPTPIDLYYASQPSGPWLPIARGLKNDGSFRWKVAPGTGPVFYVRLDVTDRAGNLTRCVAAEPVVFDMARPKARVTTVTARAPRPGPSGD